MTTPFLVGVTPFQLFSICSKTSPMALLVVATPIGNLSDLSPRALEAIRSADLLLCEDTRHTQRLLSHYGVRVPLQSFHEHNEDAKTESIIERVRGGETIVLVSDAGMPLLSDPGFPLLRRARELDLPVTPIPGPFAAALALVASGLPPVPSTFWGFAPHRSGERRRFWDRVRTSRTTAIVYESPMRVVDSLREAAEILGEIEITLAREMTKLHEEFIHGTPSTVADDLASRDSIRGEITLVLAPAAEESEELPDEERLREEFQSLRESGMKSGEAVRLLADRYGIDRREIYSMISG